MIKKVLLFFQNSMLFFVAFILFTLFVFFQKDVVPFLAQKYLKEFDVTYSSIEGTLFHGVEVSDFIYQESIKAKKLTLKYNFFSLLQPTPRVAFLGGDTVFIDLDKLLAMQSDSSHFALNISETQLTNATLRYKNENYLFDADATNLSYRELLDIEKLKLKAKTRYAEGTFEGEVREGVLRGKSSLQLSKEIEKKYIDFLEYNPKKLLLDVVIDAKKIDLRTTLKNTSIKEFSDLSIKDTTLEFSYLIEEESFTIFATYDAYYKEYAAKIKQDVFVDANFVAHSKLEAKITDKKESLPFDTFSMDIKHDNGKTDMHFSAKEIEADVKTHDFKKFFIDADTRYAKFDAELLRDKNETLIESNIQPTKEFLHYKEYDLSRFSKLFITLHEKNDEISLFVKSDILWLSIFGNEEKVKGYGAFGHSFYDYKVDLQNKTASVNTKIESLLTFTKELDANFSQTSFNAKIEAQSEIDFSDTLEIVTKMNVPLYTLKLDSKSSFSGKDGTAEFIYKENELTLKRYSFDIQNRRIFSDKTSKVFINENSDIELQEFWIFDTLLLKGLVKTGDLSADFSLKSDKFNYESPEANLSLKLDLQIALDMHKQRIDGEIEILDGTVMYKPRRTYSIGDEDIIIIQDIKESVQKSNREINVFVTSSKPIAYKTKEISLLATPNLFIHQKMNSFVEIFGVVNIKSGEVVLSDKVFELDESELYFYGGKETNPHLNLNLHYYTLDYIDIEIYVTNKMSSPVILFASKPAMSQNDILSYILFGESASSVFTAEGTSKTSLNTLLLGTGLKKMLNESTSVKFDTINILTNKEGTLGYEIGARLNKRIRIIYKNDTISSLILQYSLSKSLRVDVDIKETGQGVNIIYAKDFNLHTP
ncbi:translocation/assembly module TamB domain-containing protein [Sulfurimonas sp.]|uniref:translocation/assembly module TamB domain-containing protein n=1 Tax=Sulfurimonas sp. TaxID=2022749 RepID=UPI003D0A2298